MKGSRLFLCAGLLVLISCTGPGSTDRSLERIIGRTEHALWVTRWDFRKKQDVHDIVRDAESIGITDLYWQVRGQADALYDSDLEPRSEDLARHADADFDPLRVAIEESRARGMRLHAWVNVMPLWRGVTPPKDQSHLFHSRPYWRLRDASGRPQALHDGYIVVNPVLEGVHTHITSVVGDLVERYELDGVHLDYIRFLDDEIGDSRLMPGDRSSLTLYARQTGGARDASEVDRDRYRAWIRDRITRLVRRIDHTIQRRDRSIRLSAAVWRHPDLARDRYLQDAGRWIDEGIIDSIMPMVYTDDSESYRRDLAAWYARVDPKSVVPGIGVYKHRRSAQTLDQIAVGHPRRFAIFAYSSLFDSVNPGQDDSAEASARRREMRDAIGRLTTRVGAY